MKILFIRGGALGDFIVTLPTLRLLRQRWPDARIELLGHPRLAEIALHRYYLEDIRSVNHGPLSAFFMPRAVLDPVWMDYIGAFDLVLSYFYDPDGLFLHNLERCQPEQILTYSPRVPEHFGRPAARHFAGMVEPLGLALGNEVASELFPPRKMSLARARFSPDLTRTRDWWQFIPGAVAKPRTGRWNPGLNWGGASSRRLPASHCFWLKVKPMANRHNFSSKPGRICRFFARDGCRCRFWPRYCARPLFFSATIPASRIWLRLPVVTCPSWPYLVRAIRSSGRPHAKAFMFSRVLQR